MKPVTVSLITIIFNFILTGLVVCVMLHYIKNINFIPFLMEPKLFEAKKKSPVIGMKN